ncbi:MAG: hypothetical protein Kapaf2KO_13450 [Candidatus Kapaibacteriales bacterium]
MPTEVGLQIDTLEIFALSSVDNPDIIAGSESFIADLPVVFGSGLALLGHTQKFQNSVYLGFIAPPDTLGFLQEGEIINPRLELVFDNYAFGDSLSNFEFDIIRTMYEIPESANWEWAYGTSQWPESFSYDRSDVLTSYNAVLPLADTNFVSLPLEPSLIKEYLDVSTANSDTASYAQGSYPFGMVMLPRMNINQFRRMATATSTNQDFNPVIKFSYQTADTILEVEMQAAIVGSLIGPLEQDDVAEGDIVIGGGLRRRAQLYFDLTSVPENSTVISSEITLYSKPEMFEAGSSTPDSTVTVDSLRNPQGELSSSNFYFGFLQEDGSLRVSNLSALIAGWDISDGRDTLTFLPRRPISRMDRMVFHGANTTEVSKRPKLVLIYQKEPEL